MPCRSQGADFSCCSLMNNFNNMAEHGQLGVLRPILMEVRNLQHVPPVSMACWHIRMTCQSGQAFLMALLYFCTFPDLAL